MKTLFALLLLILMFNYFSYGQIKPLSVYSSDRLWKSQPTDDGHGFIGFRFKNVTKLNKNYLFSLYKDRIEIQYRNIISLYIDSINNDFKNSIHYKVHNKLGQYFKLILKNDLINGQHYFRFYFSQSNKDGKATSLTLYDLKKLK